MGNHWRLVLWPEHDGQLTDFLRWLTPTHAMRWHTYHTAGSGHLYQGRFKAFSSEEDEHYFAVLRAAAEKLSGVRCFYVALSLRERIAATNLATAWRTAAYLSRSERAT
ncbi:MAG: hypothetical protein K2X38_21470 [Gemmataceae bacterium]|nr:hypothetical protein [Gemmataceae bacterium]